MQQLYCVLIGYMCGGFLTAAIVARVKLGKGGGRDFGNPGTANVGAKLGVRLGLLVLIGDILKTALAVWAARAAFPALGAAGGLWAGFGAALGHDFPLWRLFRGGKGVAVTCAAAVFSLPAAGVCSGLIGLAAAAGSRYLAVGAAAIAAAFPALAALFRGGEAALPAAALGLLLLLRFLPDFADIRRGKAKRFTPFTRFKGPPSGR